jgi:hypothetical protein
MAIWIHNGADWDKLPLHRLSRPGTAVLYGCAPSLNEADLIEEGCTRFVQNWSFRKVEPHVWVGMDKPSDFGVELMNKPYLKIFRGSFARDIVDGIPACDYGMSAFADVSLGNKSDIWFRRGVNTSFVWQSNTLTIALHLILWMGFRTIVFSGIDLQGEYFDNRTLDNVQRDRINKLFEIEYNFLCDFASIAKTQDIRLINRSKKSRLSNIMETV